MPAGPATRRPIALLRAILAGMMIASIPVTVGRGMAATLDVRPTLLQLLPGQRVGVLYLVNRDDAPHTYQLSTVRWWSEGTLKHEDPTGDIIANPAVFEIRPNQTQIVRFGLRGSTMAEPERAYRLIINQLPAGEVVSASTGLNVLLRISLPLFVRAASEPPAQALSASWRQTDRELHVLLTNDGAFTLRAVKAVVANAGKAPALQSSELHYILPAGTTDFTFPLPAGWRPDHPSITLSADDGEVSVPLGPAG